MNQTLAAKSTGGSMVKMAARYSRTMQSNDLRGTDRDVLAAMALSSDFGTLIFRVKYANQASSYADLLVKWEWHTKKCASLSRWPLNISDETVARLSLDYWLNDLCLLCQGRGKDRIPFADIYSDNECPVCNGTGKKKIECNRHLTAYVAQMVDILEQLAVQAGDAAMKKLAHNVL
jgi:hypothetical protein